MDVSRSRFWEKPRLGALVPPKLDRCKQADKRESQRQSFCDERPYTENSGTLRLHNLIHLDNANDPVGARRATWIGRMVHRGEPKRAFAQKAGIDNCPPQGLNVIGVSRQLEPREAVAITLGKWHDDPLVLWCHGRYTLGAATGRLRRDSSGRRGQNRRSNGALPRYGPEGLGTGKSAAWHHSPFPLCGSST